MLLIVTVSPSESWAQSLPQYDWAGCRSADCVRSAHQYLNSTTPVLPPELSSTNGYKQLFRETASAFKKYLGQFKIDVSSRIPGFEHLHLFDSIGYQKVRELYGLINGSIGVHSTSSHLMVRVDDMDTANTAGTIQHELIHVSSYRLIDISKNGGEIHVNTLREGFDHYDNQDLRLFSEAITEMINLRVIQESWRENSTLSDYVRRYGGSQVGYFDQVCLLDALFDKISGFNTERYNALFGAIQKDYFVGTGHGLTLLMNLLSREQTAVLKRLPLDTQSVLDAAKKLGIYKSFLMKSRLLRASSGNIRLPIRE